MATTGEEGLSARHEMNNLQLSDLPDAILVHILSLLPTKSAVATSVLSRRWEYLWTSITKLQVGEHWWDDRIRILLINFIERAMLLRDASSLESLSLSIRVLDDASRINEWITAAIRCKVKELTLNLESTDERSYSLPCSIFETQSSLVKFDLTMDHHTVRLDSIFLPNLKKLRLSGIVFADDESAEKLLSHPLLEELTIHDCHWGKTETISVYCPQLQHLTIDDARSCVMNFYLERRVRFFGDNIKTFSYKGEFINEYCICGSTMQLYKAEILVERRYFNAESEINVAAKRYSKLINGLSRVQNLTLTEHFLMGVEQILQELVDTIPVFECVTQLNLSGHKRNLVRIDGEMVMEIYKKCPHLENLNILTELSGDVRGRQLRPTPGCFQSHLKRISVQSYAAPGRRGRREDVGIDVLLSSAYVLEKLVIYYAGKDILYDVETNILHRYYSWRRKRYVEYQLCHRPRHQEEEEEEEDLL